MKVAIIFITSLISSLALAQPEIPEEIANADHAFETPAGNTIRIVGARLPSNAELSDTDIGEAIFVNSIPANALCNVILNAKIKDVIDPDTQKKTGEVPDIPELQAAFGKASDPVKMHGTDDGNGNVLWNVLLKGGACVTATDSPYYVMSSMFELFPIAAMTPDSWKCRLLKAQITVTEDVGGVDQQVTLTVSACDPRVNKAKDILTIPHSWSGRTDLNFRKIKDAALQDRGKPGKVK